MVASTLVSELILTLACVVAGVWLSRQAELPRRYAAVGMAIMAATAALGCVRFAGVEGITPLHRAVAGFAGGVVPASFALVALALGWGWSRRAVELGLGVLVLGWAVFGLVLQLAIYGTAIGSVAVVIMIGVAIRDRSTAGLALIGGALILALAGLVIGTKGTLGPLLAVDVFHVALAAAHLLIAVGLAGLALRADIARAL